MYATILLCLVLAEVLRRCCKILLNAFTGPMSKIPGPWIMRLSNLPWKFVVLQGQQINRSPKLFAKYGDVVRIGPGIVLLAGKNSIYKVLVEDDLKKSPHYATVREDPNVANLITERDNLAYKQKRRLLSAGFSVNYLNGLEPLMQQCIQMFTINLKKKCAKSSNFAIIDFSLVFANLGFDIMSATSFGGSFELTSKDDTRTRHIFRQRLMRTALLAQFPFLKYIPFVPSPMMPEMDDMITRIISKRRKSTKAGEVTKDLLQIFLDAHDANPDEFTMKHVYEEMRLFMIAGSDTTATTATFTTFLLLQNPSKLKLLISEIDTAFPNIDDDITFESTQYLPYLNACINESMRVKPIITGGLPRITEKPIILDGYEIAAGVIVSSYLDAMMRDPKTWSEPDKFVPERWIGDSVDRKGFLPFSAGLRSCIGQQFALKELRLVLATLLRKFELSVVQGQSYEMRVHTVPYFKQGKYLVLVEPRV